VPEVNETTAPPLALSADIKDKVGVFEIRKGVFLEVLEKQAYKKHRHFRASLPESNGVEDGFDAGPVYSIYAEDSHVDIRSGLTLIDGRTVRETAVVPKLIDRYQGATAKELEAAPRIADSHIILPLASQRMGNYCRWWLDSVAKMFVCSRSTVLRENLRASAWDMVIPNLPLSFQRQTIDLLTTRPLIVPNTRDRLLRARTVNSSGLTFGGGQRIGAMVREMSRFLDLLIPMEQAAPGDRSGELLFVSRNESSMRRIVNEDELLPGLRDMGFKIFSPGKHPLRTQIDAFRNARVVLAAHGAGLTNIVFCRPKTTLIEIFPEEGVHGSAFLRIASHLRFNYYFIVGKKVETPQGLKNPNNSDILLDVAASLRFIRQAIETNES
jgi:capsular polysaccharide biosynthesis protein